MSSNASLAAGRVTLYDTLVDLTCLRKRRRRELLWDSETRISLLNT